MSHFTFLAAEWPDVYDPARRAERIAHADPRASCFYARRALELAVRWAFKHDPGLRLPYQDNLSALVHEPSFKAAAGEAVFGKARIVIAIGNRAVHEARPVTSAESLRAVGELFHICYWLARTYGRASKPPAALRFDEAALVPGPSEATRTREQLRALEQELRDRDEKLADVLAGKQALDEELQRLRQEVARARAEADARPDDHDYSEGETRDQFIDLLLQEAGWPLGQARDREYEVAGMPNGQGKGFVDYVLWGDDGKPLGLVEAKRTRRDARVGQQQAKLYADCLEAQFGQRPVVFYSNGYEHWIWDDQRYPPRQVQGFYKKAELELLIQRRRSRRPLDTAPISVTIVERHYQTRAIRRVAESFERDHERKALLVMATGAGKTRTVIALADLLLRCNWAKRVLFLADRVALVNQAVNAFKTFLPEASPVNLVTDRHAEGRVYVSTYPTMMGLIDETRDQERRFGVGHFDLVVIDEAHRSVFQKYRAIFEYFDSLLVGLTATPKDEIDRNTYGLFDLETGVPTDAYSLDEAVADGFLVPFKAVSVPLKFQREGIAYDDLPPDEKDAWDALEWDEDGEVPDRVEAEAVNKWLFNADTVDKVIGHFMERGIKVAGGDRLGKTIVFAKNQAHAEFIAERFNLQYPHYRGEFARVITFKTEYAQSLIDAFASKDRDPHVAISVDMLDTGIDVPEVVNLVFFKLVRSRTKFWQMIGRGTRLCRDLFAPGQDKAFFYIFDYCQNLEFFSQNPQATDGGGQDSLARRLFLSRLELVGELDKQLAALPGGDGVREVRPPYGVSANAGELRYALADRLHGEVAAMNLQNIIVRPHRRLVEVFAKREAWVSLSAEQRAALAEGVAGLPAELQAEDEEAKRFDLLLLNLQLARMRAEPGFERMRDRVKEIAGQLEELGAIPMVRDQMVLIQDLQTDEWWQDVTVPQLELVRLRLRTLVRLIEKRKRTPLYVDFEDAIGPGIEIELGTASAGMDYERFKAKAQAFLRAHIDHIAVAKLRTNRPLTASDLDELARMLRESAGASPQHLERAAREAEGLGLFVRSLVGLDREAAKEAFAGFLQGTTLTGNQIQFVNLIVDHLTSQGAMKPERLYESPFTDVAPHGPDQLFQPEQVDVLFKVLDDVRRSASAA